MRYLIAPTCFEASKAAINPTITPAPPDATRDISSRGGRPFASSTTCRYRMVVGTNSVEFHLVPLSITALVPEPRTSKGPEEYRLGLGVDGTYYIITEEGHVHGMHRSCTGLSYIEMKSVYFFFPTELIGTTVVRALALPQFNGSGLICIIVLTYLHHCLSIGILVQHICYYALHSLFVALVLLCKTCYYATSRTIDHNTPPKSNIVKHDAEEHCRPLVEGFHSLSHY